MDKFFYPHFDILMNWASHFETPQKSLPKFYLYFWRYLEKKIFILLDLISFFHTGKPVSSRMLVEVLCSDGFHMLYVPNFMKSWMLVQTEKGWYWRMKWVIWRYFFSVNIFIIKQSMLLTFLRLLRIVSSVDWKHNKRDYRIDPQFI